MSYIKVGCTIQVFEMKSDRVLTPKEARRFKTHSRVIQWPSLKSVERLFCRLNVFPKKHSPKKLPLIVSSCLPTSNTCVNKLSLPFDDMVPPTYSFFDYAFSDFSFGNMQLLPGVPILGTSNVE